VDEITIGARLWTLRRWRGKTMPRAGSWGRTMDAAERTATTLEAQVRSYRVGIHVLGQLTLTVALAAAVAQNGGAAAHWLNEADRLANRVTDDPAHGWHSFSKTNVSVWGVAVGVERGESGQWVRGLASRVDQAKLSARKSRLASFRCDVGRGLAPEQQTRVEAVRWLRRAEDTTPQRVRNSPSVRETVAYLLNQATLAAGGRELRGMAARMGLPH